MLHNIDTKLGDTSRRLDPDRQKNSALKALAGHIAGLSYRDMQSLAKRLIEVTPVSIDERSMADALVTVADEILAEDTSSVAAGPKHR